MLGRYFFRVVLARPSPGRQARSFLRNAMGHREQDRASVAACIIRQWAMEAEIAVDKRRPAGRSTMGQNNQNVRSLRVRVCVCVGVCTLLVLLLGPGGEGGEWGGRRGQDEEDEEGIVTARCCASEVRPQTSDRLQKVQVEAKQQRGRLHHDHAPLTKWPQGRPQGHNRYLVDRDGRIGYTYQVHTVHTGTLYKSALHGLWRGHGHHSLLTMLAACRP